MGIRMGSKDEFGVFPLVSFPGSGNTWTRMLLEKSTGIYTGSIYNDQPLFKAGMLGEITLPKDGETLFQKSHDIKDEQISNPRGILFLLRNPFEAVVAEWKRRLTKGHTSDVEENVFKGEEWQNKGSYFLKKWRTLAKEVIDVYLENKNVSLHVFFYENLKADALHEMEQILDFIAQEDYFHVSDRSTRMNCLKNTLEETEKFHRPKKKPSFEYFTKPMIEKGNQYINEVYDLLEQNNFPTFEKRSYLKQNTAS
ncbi:Oidioi.mRNA.OKI2018_I69.PAR.g9846.t1.cds [Oikopleura dioica]|uniref:Oidioi.mRNA.OKI2018_I69.PAR.g9846.t1.cds n=1 Tax=Oikopleura dioica TaxID=34765 RepID=A0ABN7RT07_OIKDI|nr:Oidioi.mRNA.OKI2018_I69.PAR.g9846.t1.cds [Oikopleura dioica]